MDSGRKPSTSPARIAGRYELQEQLGEGGMGVVWRALDTKTGSYVAIKLMKDVSDPVAVELFEKEWRAVAEISHPNIVEVRDVDVIEENKQKKPFFVMPLLQGATLAELIANASARLTLSRVVEITGQVCKGLQAAHQRGLVHRDLKPSNIFVMADDTAKIIDFGVVHLAGSKSVTGQKGTFQYMSPEQAQLKEITPASDLFSLGVILYEALTLRKPFARKTADETMTAVCKYIPPPVSEINPSISQSVSQVVHKCLAKQPIHRFSSARDLSETLQKAFRNEPIFDAGKIQPRIERAKTAFKAGDEAFASEILAEIEAEGHLDPQITVLRTQIDMVVRRKKIRQLLESARARMEQDEIPLALDKVREVLELDPENPDGLAMRVAMEKQRNETQIAKWLDLAHTHLDNRDFGAAMHAVQEVLTIRRGDTRALDLLEKIESTEVDAKRIREQKEQLYTSALRAYQNGEIETALSKLERLFSVARQNPEAAVPERDAVYQSFYKEVRSEHDSIHSSLEEAQRQFSEKDFAGALAICQDLLSKHPNDGAFQALKIQIEDAERQELSAYIAEVSRRIESEPDLDRRANILREACERYPNETQFAQQLKSVRERRDLVNSIVAKARQYEERGQYSEAIGQWDVLRNIHPKYPGIAFELEQCKKKRDRQASEEEKARLVDEIDRLMESRAFAKAIERVSAGLQEFPGDTELIGLQGLAEQGLERTKESRRLFEEGQQAIAQRDLNGATELLRSAMRLDPRGPGLRDALVSVLTERARSVAEENWQAADPLYQEANDLDANHPEVRALRSTISEAKRSAFVGQCLTEARGLVASGNPQAAFERVKAGRAQYPRDLRLEQYEACLLKDVRELQYKAERNRDWDALKEDRRTVEENPDERKLKQIAERSVAARLKYRDDSEIEQTVSEIERMVKRGGKAESLEDLLRPGTLSASPSDRKAPGGAKAAPKPDAKKRPEPAPTKVFPQPSDGDKTAVMSGATAFFRQIRTRVLEFVRPRGKWSTVNLVSGGAIVLAVVGFVVGHNKPWRSQRQLQPVSVEVHINTTPSDSTVAIDSKKIEERVISLPPGVTNAVEVSRIGYQSKTLPLTPAAEWNIVLEPEKVHLSIQTSEKSGTVELDGQQIGELSDGSLEGELTPDGNNHTLSLVAQRKHLFTIEFQAVPGVRPRLSNLDANDLLVIASLQANATVYGNNLKSVKLGDQNIAGVTVSGVDLPPLTDQNNILKYGEGSDQGSVTVDVANVPALLVHSLDTEGMVAVTANVESATLTVDGQPVRHQKHGWRVSRPPGTYTFVLSADGYESQTWTMTLQLRQTFNKNIILPITVKAPTTASLVIAGGTPGSEVDLDGKKIGELDSNGNGQFPNLLSVGQHALILQKSGYESRRFDLSVKPPSESRVNDAKLTQYGTLVLQTATKNVTAKYRRVGDSQWIGVSPPASLPLAAGQYEVEADAVGFQHYKTEVKINPGQTVPLPLKLPVTWDCPVQDSNQVVQDGEWFKPKAPGSVVYLKPGCLSVTLLFTKPKSTMAIFKKKVQVDIMTADSHARVQYELEEQKVTRKLITGEETSDPKDAKVSPASATPNIFLVHVRVEGARVRITNEQGESLDDYTASGHDFSNGKIGIKTDSQFIVRSNN
jgi:serine/threonine protein kinase